MSIGAVHTAVVGRLGEIELAAIGLANSIAVSAMLFGLGIMLGLDPLIAQALGAGERPRARAWLWQGIWIATAVGLLLAVLVAGSTLVLERLGIDQAAVPATQAYLFARLPSLVLFLLMAAVRSFLQAHGHTWPMLAGVVAANLINLPLTFLTVLGWPEAGIPSFGVVGAGVSATFCSAVQLGVVALAARVVARETPAAPATPFSRAPRLADVGRALRLGLPIGLALLAEVMVFAIVGILMGNIGSRSLAAHQVALTLASATFQVPIAIGAAGSVRVGQAIGRRDHPGTRLAGLTAIGTGAAFMLFAAVLFWLLPGPLAAVFTDQPRVIAAAVPLLIVAAVFQLSDGVQAVAAGTLRGSGDTLYPLAANVVGHYVIGLPLGIVLAFVLDWRASGLWWGLSAGLTAVALALTARFLHLTRRPIVRV